MRTLQLLYISIGVVALIALPVRARLLETRRALWRYRVALHDAALDQLEQLR